MRNLTAIEATELTGLQVQMIDPATGNLDKRAPTDLFGAVEQYPAFANFPVEGKENILYVDQSVDPFMGYVWDGTEYQMVGSKGPVVHYQTNSLTFPANPTESDELIVTEDGTVLGKVLEQWIYNGTAWQERPQSEPIPMAGSVLAAIACVGSPVLVPTGNKQDVQTVGTGGDYADLPAALASANVAAGTVLKVLSDQVISATLNVNKAVVIDLNGFKLDSTTTAPVNMVNMTAPLSVIKNGVINHLKTANTSVETVFNLASTDPAKPVFVVGNTINVQEFGVVARGNYVVADNTFGYIGASLTNSHRFIALYGNSGESKITGNKFTAITAATTRYSNFILMGSTTGTVYGGKLYIDNNTQTGGSLRQFFFHEAGAAGGMELYVANNTFDDLNGGIGIVSPTLYNSYSKIGVFSNTQGASAIGNFKGVFFVDGSGALSDTVELTYGGNVTTAGPLRADYVSLDADSTNLIAVKNTITFTSKKEATVVSEESLEALGELLQDLKGKQTFIVDSEGESIEGNGTETDPFKIPPAKSSTVLFGSSSPTAPGGDGPDEFIVTSDGTPTGAILEQWIWAPSQSLWIERPAGAKEAETTSLVAQVHNGTAFVGAQTDVEINAADFVLLSDGTRVHSGKVKWTGHGLTVGNWYYTSQTTAGAYVTPKPTTGWVQQLFSVEDENTIHIDIEEAWSADGSTEPAFNPAKMVYLNAATPATATIFDTANPPVTNDNTLKQDDQNLYTGLDGSLWRYNTATSLYEPYVFPAATKVAFYATKSTAQAIPAGSNNTTVVTAWDVATTNTAGAAAFNPATGVYTVQKSGRYLITAALMYAKADWIGATAIFQDQSLINAIRINDVGKASQRSTPAANYFGYASGGEVTYGPVQLAVGNTISIATLHTEATARSLHPSPSVNRWSITEV